MPRALTMQTMRLPGPFPIFFGVFHLIVPPIVGVALVAVLHDLHGHLLGKGLFATGGLAAFLSIGVALVFFWRGGRFFRAALAASIALFLILTGVAAFLTEAKPLIPVGLATPGTLWVALLFVAWTEARTVVRTPGGNRGQTFALGVWHVLQFLLWGIMATGFASLLTQESEQRFAMYVVVSCCAGFALWFLISACAFLRRLPASYGFLLPSLLLVLALFGFLLTISFNDLRAGTDKTRGAQIIIGIAAGYTLLSVLLLLLPLRRRKELAGVSPEGTAIAPPRLLVTPVLVSFVLLIGGGGGALFVLDRYGVSREPLSPWAVSFKGNASVRQAGKDAKSLCWPGALRAGGLAHATVSFADGTQVEGFRARGTAAIDVEFEFADGARRKLALRPQGAEILWPEQRVEGLRLRVFARDSKPEFCIEAAQFLKKGPIFKH